MNNPTLIIYYECPRCWHRFIDTWDCAVDNDCPKCGNRHISPHHVLDIPPWEKAEEPQRVVLSMEGGLIHEAISDREMTVVLIDHDTDGLDEESLTPVPQTDGTSSLCYVSEVESTVDAERMENLLRDIFP